MAPTRTQTPNPPRAPNKWLCFCAEFSTRYMTAKQNAAMTMNPEQYRKMAEQLPSVAKLASKAWWRGGEPLHRYWEEVARRRKIQHRQSYPNYTYQPRRNILMRQRPRTPTPTPIRTPSPTPAPAPAPALGDMGNGDSSEARTSVPSGVRLIKPSGYVAGGGAMDVEREDRPPPAGSFEIIDLTHDDDDDDKHVDVIEVNRPHNASITRQADVIDLTEEEDEEMSADASAEIIEEIQRTPIVPASSHPNFHRRSTFVRLRPGE
ncbi:hypothetical protein CPB84DRAFT_961059 [Gymnopilus junonius]|uniref:HMG box domain-containing protein n=1 Tax=Gymnopilus junonius TaxID=109634 RepID=A0A9P5NQQ9_GYMJU|nr:hypothetical protein CPB84DRAFT_961059 [Gymnopilus junonius]